MYSNVGECSFTVKYHSRLEIIVYNGKKRAFMIVLLLLDRIISDHGGCAKPGAKGVAAKYRSRSTFLRFIGGYYVLLAMQRLW